MIVCGGRVSVLFGLVSCRMMDVWLGVMVWMCLIGSSLLNY